MAMPKGMDGKYFEISPASIISIYILQLSLLCIILKYLPDTIFGVPLTPSLTDGIFCFMQIIIFGLDFDVV